MWADGKLVAWEAQWERSGSRQDRGIVVVCCQATSKWRLVTNAPPAKMLSVAVSAALRGLATPYSTLMGGALTLALAIPMHCIVNQRLLQVFPDRNEHR